MVRLIALLIGVIILNGCFINSVDCEAVADAIIFNEGFNQLNSNEKK